MTTTPFCLVWDEPGEGSLDNRADPYFPSLRFSLDDTDPALARNQADQLRSLVRRLNTLEGTVEPAPAEAAPADRAKALTGLENLVRETRTCVDNISDAHLGDHRWIRQALRLLGRGIEILAEAQKENP